MSDAHAAQLVEAVLAAYRQGYFPMAEVPEGHDPAAAASAGATRSTPQVETFESLHWFSPDPRAVVPIEHAPGAPGGVRLPRSLRARLRSGAFQVTSDEAFERVILECARPRPGTDGWIDERIIALYTLLHRHGCAHSVEAWLPTGDSHTRAESAPAQDTRDRNTQQGRQHPPAQTEQHAASRILVGGLYGVHIGAAFFGESMFCRPELGGTDASKVCFIQLVHHLRARGFLLLDSQFSNPHMESLGITEIPRREYRKRLALATGLAAQWSPWKSGMR